MTIKAVQYGVGPIGSRIAKLAANRGIEFVGAVDIDPEKTGRDFGEIIGVGKRVGVEVTGDENAAFDRDPDIVFHSTSSSLTTVAPQLRSAFAAGADVISTTEELSYPWWKTEDLATELDERARQHDVTCLGTGINPGFAMDAFPAVLTTTCQSVQAVRVERRQDAAQRRKSLQEKIGAGLAPETFEKEIASNAGHIGLIESVAMLADALDWKLTNIEEDIDPVISESLAETDFVTVNPGDVAGIHQTAKGFANGDVVVELDLKMYIGAPDPRDTMEIRGEPTLQVSVDGGFHGDKTTPAIVVNAVPIVQAADSGLASAIDLPIFSCYGSI